MPDTPGTWLQLALVLRESGEVVGDCGIHFRRDEPRQVELGITLGPAYQGRGLAKEALSSVLGYVFDSLGKHRASAVTDVENHLAAGLFRSLGFRQEAHFVEHVWFKAAWGSEYVFALLQREWQASRGSHRP
jgi:RimJ/RimL family protein N-acetyltransferase